MTARAEPTRSVLIAHPSVEMYGADRMLLESVRALVDSGWTVTVALPGAGPLADAVGELDCEVVLVEVPVLRKAFLSPTGVLRLGVAVVTSAPRQVRLLQRTRAEVVYVNTVTIPTWVLLSRLLGRQVVCHVHEAEDEASSLVRHALAAPLLLAHLVLANSGASRDVLAADYPSLARGLRVVYNGFDGPSEMVPVRAELTAPVRLVLVGRVSPRKGTDVAVDALRLLVAEGVDAVLDVVGGVFAGYEWFLEQVQSQALEAGLEGRIRWRGEVPDPYAVLAEADIAVVPSRKEPFGNTAVEALLTGRPVVVAAAQGLVEVVRGGIDGEVVAAGDPAALAAGVRALMADWPAASERAARAAVSAAERFSRARYARDVVGALDDVLARTRSSRRGSRRASRRTSSPRR